MVKIQPSVDTPVAFKTNVLTITRGGRLNRQFPLISKDVPVPAHQHPWTFVRVRTRDPWLNRAVMGHGYRADLYPGVLTELRDKLVAAEIRKKWDIPEEEKRQGPKRGKHNYLIKKKTKSNRNSTTSHNPYEGVPSCRRSREEGHSILRGIWYALDL